MHRILDGLKKAIIYVFAFVLVAGYPATAMADTQEPTTANPTSSTTDPTAQTVTDTTPQQTQTPAPADPSSSSSPTITTTTTTPPAPTIIEPPATTQTTQDPASSTSQPTTDTTASAGTNADTVVNANSAVNSNATSGDSTVSSNTTAGSAKTGDAAAAATLLNVVNSAVTTGDNQKVATFTKDILGDVKGDIVLYPLLLKAMLEANANNSTAATVSATSNLDVNNTVNVAAQSGNATVSKNTFAGNATTGSAQAVANVVNILNSMIAAHDSFIGTINIYGNLEGDILIAPDFIPQLLANNGTSNSGNTKVSNQDTTAIVNNISAVAQSGAASVFGNTVAGDAKTGDSLSNVVIFNVTGHDIVAKNSLLVFVNVLGKWVGMIVDAPANATAAMIGNGVTTNTTYAPDLTVNAQSSHGITNTIAVTAQSGDATVDYNTNAGNAVTGQARALANIANVSGSQFGISDWFGVLFINVFQNWYGSFGIDTPYGNTTTTEQQPTGPIQFTPSTSAGTTTNSRANVARAYAVYRSGGLGQPDDTRTVLAAATTQPMSKINTSGSQPLHRAVEQEPYDFRLLIVVGSMFMIGLSAIGIRRLLQQ